MNWPTVEAVYIELCAMRGATLIESDGIDVRLQVYPDGRWAVRFGDSSYDTDHHGYWGAGTISAGDTLADIRDLANELLDEAQEQKAQEEG